MWDTSGHGHFQPVVSELYRRADGFIVVYDITNRKSFNAVHDWMTMIGKHADTNISCILVGNKSDLDTQSGRRQVCSEEAQLVAEQYCIKF